MALPTSGFQTFSVQNGSQTTRMRSFISCHKTRSKVILDSVDAVATSVTRKQTAGQNHGRELWVPPSEEEEGRKQMLWLQIRASRRPKTGLEGGMRQAEITGKTGHKAAGGQGALLKHRAGGHVTEAPSRGPHVTEAPSRGPHVTEAPSRGPHVTEAPSRGPRD
ncbi:uncharacterized protein LOC125960768 [Orcinus orca]|uniref:uncharacterized protein LOC125960768 n=1 Tax=Orcinus orca TaxID=9733 RepID=UPI002112C01C|nr:uncharacterized protein LOC125960768 [Orcinus orca]XP_049551721.1 uncharacterized protein LOC125960768 [Orcinus orca]